MELWILFGSFITLLLIGTPVAFCLGVSSLATVLYLDLPPVIVFQRLNSGVSVYALMAIPFFIFAGDLMVRGDIARRLVALAGAAVGHMRGGLGQVNILASVMFGGVSGSAAADASAVGGLMVPQMKERGYGVDYAVNITVVSSIIALMIPIVAIWTKHQQKIAEMQVHTTADATAEKAAQYASKIQSLEDRVRVLERIVTDGGYDVATQIEALRDARRVEGGSSGVPLGLETGERV